jgi:hypothetical protein
MIPDDLRAFLEAAEDGMELRIVHRHRTPLLLLPEDRALAQCALDLYPAQTAKARLARAALRWLMPLGLPVVRLRPVAGSPVATLLRAKRFAVYLGNPRSLGRRFLFLADGLVVKAGAGRLARALIMAEADFLQTTPRLRGVPALIARQEDADAAALVTAYVRGRSPRPGESPGELLSDWIDTGGRVRLETLPAWQQLVAGADLPPRVAALGRREVFAPLLHGDFAPWNVKVADGEWQVLDWERGARHGPPGWDWLHFAVQPRVLVERCTPAQLHPWLRRMAQEPAFLRYLTACGLEDAAEEIIASYLLHGVFVLRPSEGLETLRGLLAAWIQAG